MSRPWSLFDDHLRLAVRLTPNGARDALDGIKADGEGEAFLKARVTAVPEKGKANKALMLLIAKSLRIPKSSVSLVSGETARKKILRIDGDPEDLVKKLEIFLG
ncbi:DUF167 domain-containing protein [Rhizobium leguminosarum]|uniref:DUF167 domain-containing protein n=1 Tax=Rhizobium TaxID=379 RepID=UPI0010312FD5|nr:DUF167 domain-containing protein [Rhizobium leguminosarum]MBY5390472.1 DUF167 domain-containing protein [Rhizobium leguminosarum]MBY5432595.1 DUF167 domain-containing protein [Rhizobium leguminosarum]NEK43594.1 DUF167 domain-containing protein [Rhizobium leguminosarum]TBF37739.1 DUF167 domain-containing protein [Rhizobium leguminosarum]TBH56114.1 DUF167 domain-containing protein [Rhizobium leguminosarum]